MDNVSHGGNDIRVLAPGWTGTWGLLVWLVTCAAWHHRSLAQGSAMSKRGSALIWWTCPKHRRTTGILGR